MSDNSYITSSGKTIRWTGEATQSILDELAYLRRKAMFFTGGIGGDWQESVKSVVGTIPLSPESGDRYIFTGAGVHENYLIEYDGDEWIYTAPDEGMTAFVEDEDVPYYYNGIDWIVQPVVAHTHTENQITDLDKYSQSEVDSLLSGKANSVHNHDDRYYTESEMDTLLSGKSDTAHNHDGRYLLLTGGTLGGDVLFNKTGTATGIPDTYGSYELQFKGSVWDTTNSHAEDRRVDVKLQADPGPDGSEPYKLIIEDNAGNRCFTFNFTEDKHGLTIGSDWAGTWSGLPLLLYKDHNSGYVARIHNTSTGELAYSGIQFLNDASHAFEIGLGGASRGDTYQDVAWIWPGANINKMVVGVGGTEKAALTPTGFRVQPDMGIDDVAVTPLDVRTASPITPPALSAYNAAIFVGPDNAAISIVSANTHTGYIFFSDTDAQGAAWLAFNHTSNYMEQAVGGVARTRLTSGGLAVSPTANYNAIVPLDVRVASAVTPPTLLGATVACFIGAANAQITIMGSTAGNTRLYFGDTDDEDVAGFDYDHDTDEMNIIINGSPMVNLKDKLFTVDNVLGLLERSTDPEKPPEGLAITWMSDGTGLGDDGDVLVASTAGGTTTYTIVHDHSAGTVWS